MTLILTYRQCRDPEWLWEDFNHRSIKIFR